MRAFILNAHLFGTIGLLDIDFVFNYKVSKDYNNFSALFYYFKNVGKNNARLVALVLALQKNEMKVGYFYYF